MCQRYLQKIFKVFINEHFQNFFHKYLQGLLRNIIIRFLLKFLRKYLQKFIYLEVLVLQYLSWNSSEQTMKTFLEISTKITPMMLSSKNFNTNSFLFLDLLPEFSKISASILFCFPKNILK